MQRAVIIALAAVVLFCAFEADAARRKRRKRRAKKGVIHIVSPVDGASVYLDGKLWGTTPLSPLRINARSYRVTVKKLGYLEFEQRLVVKAGLKSTLEAKLLPVAGVIDVSAGESARVLVDGVDRGETPLRVELPVGDHEIVVVAGSREERKVVKAVAGQVIAIAAFGGAPDADLDLALTPLGEETPVDSDIALVPPNAAPDDGLALELDTPDDGLALELPKAQAGDDGLELEALPLDLPPDSKLAVIDPLNPNGIQQTAASNESQQWYTEWWALSAGGALVVGAVATTIALSSGDGDDDEYTPDRTFRTEGNDAVGP